MKFMKQSFRAKKKMALQLTSLLDMFTIILVFLMVSFQAEDRDFVLHSGVQLPASSARSPFKTGVNVALTLDAVFVDGKKVYDLEEDGMVSEKDRDSGLIDNVARAVEQAWEKAKKDKEDENVVVIQASRALPYRTIHLVMRSAASVGFYRFRLAVEKE